MVGAVGAVGARLPARALRDQQAEEHNHTPLRQVAGPWLADGSISPDPDRVL